MVYGPVKSPKVWEINSNVRKSESVKTAKSAYGDASNPESPNDENAVHDEAFTSFDIFGYPIYGYGGGFTMPNGVPVKDAYKNLLLNKVY